MKDTTRKSKPQSETPPPEAKRARILLVDDHPVVREGLRNLIDRQTDLTVCAEAANAQQAMNAVPKHKPDLVIVDLSLEGSQGMELIKNLHTLHPNLPMLVLSMHDESLYAERALRAGSRGYLMKHSPPEQLITAIHEVLAGRISVSDAVANRLLQQATSGRPIAEPKSPVETLSDRELEVFEFIGRGLGTREIADKLHLSVKTVEAHRATIKRKLRVRTAAELIHSAIQWAQQEGSD